MSAGLDFSTYIIERTRDFTGREWVFAEIDRWLADPNAPRYFIVTGEPGIGKTAIAARLTQIRELSASHFCMARQPETLDPLAFVRSISAQLASLEKFADCLLVEQGVHVNVRIDVRENYGQIIGVQINNLTVDAPSATVAFNRAVLDPLQRMYAGAYNHQLVVLIDALDEAVQHIGPETIVDVLANARQLPEPVRFVLTSRPEGGVLRHFEESAIPHLVLDAGREENQADVRTYLRKRWTVTAALQAQVPETRLNDFIEQLSMASKGNFLYLVWLLPAIIAGELPINDLANSPAGLDGIYREFLRTRTLGKDIDRWRSYFRPLLGVLVAAQEALTVEQLACFTGLGKQAVHDFLVDVLQFLSPELAAAGRFQLYHQSIVDFLKSRERAAELWIDLMPIHRRIADYYNVYAPDRWRDCDLYGMRHLPKHILSAAEVENLKSLLLNFIWLQAKLDALDITALIADYELYSGDDELRLVGETLSLSAAILANDKGQLAGHLLGRLIRFKKPGIKQLLEQVRYSMSQPWLCPSTPCLTAPGGALRRTLIGHNAPVRQIAATRDCHYAISNSWGLFHGSSPGTKGVIVWDTQSGQELQALLTDGQSYCPCAITGDGHYALALNKEKGKLLVWDMIQQGDPQLRDLYGESFSPTLQVPRIGHYILSIRGSSIVVRDIESWDIVQTLEHNGQKVSQVEFTNDARYMVTATTDRTVRIWDFQSSDLIGTFAGPSNSNRIVSLNISDDGQYIVSVWDNLVLTPRKDRPYSFDKSGTDDHTIKVWETNSGKECPPLESNAKFIRILGMTMTSDGRHLCLGVEMIDSYIESLANTDYSLKVWDIHSGQLLWILNGHSGRINKVVVTKDGHYAISGSDDNSLIVWDLVTGQLLHTLQGHSGAVTALACSEDGRLVVSASSDQTLKIWDISDLDMPQSIQEHTLPINAVAVTSNGRRAVSASADRTLKLWDTCTGEALSTFKAHEGFVNAVALSGDGRYAVSGSADETLMLWNIHTGQILCKLECSRPSGKHSWNKSFVNGVAFTGDGRYVLAVSADGIMRRWDWHTGRKLRDLEHKWHINAVVVTDDGRYAVTAGDERSNKEWLLKVWDLSRGETAKVLKGHTGPINALALARDGRYVISGSADRTVKAWDLHEARLCWSGEHLDDVKAVALTSDGRYAISGSHGRVIKVWGMESGRTLATFVGEAFIGGLAAMPDGRSIVVGDGLGRLYTLQLENFSVGPPIITAWRRQRVWWAPWRWREQVAFGCPNCLTWSKVAIATLGQELPCPRCAKHLKLNSFTINSDWHSAEESWKESTKTREFAGGKN